MDLIGAQDLAAARSAMGGLLSSTAVHKTQSRSVSSSGSTSKGFVTQGSVNCLVYMNDRAPNENSEIGEAKANIATHIIRVPYDSEITVGDRMVIDGKTFQITAVGNSDTNRFILSLGAQRIFEVR